MARRTVSLPDSVDALIRDSALPGESYSGTVARLVEAGARSDRRKKPPGFIGVADVEVPEDLSRRTEKYLSELLLRDVALGR